MRRNAAAAAVAALLVGCGGSPAVDRPEPARSGELLVRAQGAAALAPLPDGELLFGELASGRIRRVDGDGSVRDVARVPVSTGGQRGLLSLAVDGRGRIYAAYTESAAPRRRLVVARIGPDARRVVWRGPPSRELANGGRGTPHGRAHRLLDAPGDPGARRSHPARFARDRR